MGAARDQTLREFYGVMDPRESAIMEHRNYLLAASTQFCAADILEMIGDKHGRGLVRRYELAYNQYFAMFCDHARARQTGKTYMLEMLLPECAAPRSGCARESWIRGGVPPLPLSALKAFLGTRPRSEPLDPGPQIQLQRPSASRLPMQTR